MNHAQNLFSVVSRFFTALFAAIRWLSDDYNAKQINALWDSTEKVLIRTVQFYRDNGELVRGVAKAVIPVVEAAEKAKADVEAFAPKFEDVAQQYVRDTERFEHAAAIHNIENELDALRDATKTRVVENELHIAPEDVREVRNALGMTQEQFAEKVGVTLRTILRWENGTTKLSRKQARMVREVGGK